MPTYHFRCKDCARETQARLSFGSTEQPDCETCGKPMTKFIVPPTVHFKGGGFYKTDGERKETKKPEAPKPPDPPKPPAPSPPSS